MQKFINFVSASSKKREIGVTQVLTPSKLSPRNPPTTNGEGKFFNFTSYF